MASVRVLEYVRFPRGVWNLPRELSDSLRRDFPGVQIDSPESREEADALAKEADVVFGYGVTPANFASAARLRWIHSPAAGVGHLLFPELVASAVTLTNSRGMHAEAMAEHALAMMLAFVRKLHHSREAQLAARWEQNEQWDGAPPFGSLAGATLGLVGLGRVGSALASKARALGMRVLAIRRHPAADPTPADEQWGSERLPELLAASDWVVLVAPHTPATDRLIGARELARMKPTARLVNLGRGQLVDDAALIDALRSGRIAGAALDVFSDEPLPAESPYWGMREVILSPHTSGIGPRYWERSCELFARNLRHYVAGEPLENVVDKAAGY